MERVYVGNLPPDIRIKDIDDFFKPFGRLVYVDINHHANPVYACVQFDSARNAFNAVKSRHGYDYEGYTLQLRLLENEVRKRRDATPPPPPPRMFGSYDRINNIGFNNSYGSSNDRMGGHFSNSSFQSNSSSQWSNNSRLIGQQNMVQYPATNRVKIPQQNMMGYSPNNSTNIESRNMMQYSCSSNLNMHQQYSNTNCSNMQQTYSENYRNDNCSYNETNSNGIYNINNEPTNTSPGFEEGYTRGLSGSGRKWFSRYLRKGLSPEMARIKALEHRTVPYLRSDYTKNDQTPNNPTNAALETIGNTIISLLSTNSVNSYNNNRDGGNFGMHGPSSSNISGRKPSQAPRNPVSKAQYHKSLEILKRFRAKNEGSAKDRISKKYHTQIVKDFEQFEKKAGKPSARKTISTTSVDKLSEMLRKKKKEFLTSAISLGSEIKKRRYGGAQKKRYKLLLDEGFIEIEAKTLSNHTIDNLKPLISLKREYDMATKKTDFMQSKKINSGIPKSVVYRNDINYLKQYQKEKLSNLSPRIRTALRECLTRIHKYEQGNNIPLTRTKFVSLLLNDSSITAEKKRNENKSSSNAKKDTSNKNETTATATSVASANKKKIEVKNNKNSKDVNIKPKEEKDEKDDNQDITEDDGNEHEFEDENEDQNEQDFEDAANSENMDDQGNQNDNVADQN